MKTEITAVFTVQERDDDNDLIEVEFSEAEADIRFEESEYNGSKVVKRKTHRITLTHDQLNSIAQAQASYLRAHDAVKEIAKGVA